jgi:hypothetical protein
MTAGRDEPTRLANAIRTLGSEKLMHPTAHFCAHRTGGKTEIVEFTAKTGFGLRENGFLGQYVNFLGRSVHVIKE